MNRNYIEAIGISLKAMLVYEIFTKYRALDNIVNKKGLTSLENSINPNIMPKVVVLKSNVWSRTWTMVAE